MEPFESFVRTRIGTVLPPAEIARVSDRIRTLLADAPQFRAALPALRRDWVYNLGNSGAAGAKPLR
ncbi:MAG: hypothetical protein R3F24_03000 [Gammaproteobacteria bacterium]